MGPAVALGVTCAVLVALPLPSWLRLAAALLLAWVAFRAGSRGGADRPSTEPAASHLDERSGTGEASGGPVREVERVAGAMAHDVNNVMTVVTGRADLLLAALPMDDPSRPDVEHIRRAGEQGTELAGRLLALWRRSPPSVKAFDPVLVVGDSESALRAVVGPDVSLRVEVVPPVPAVEADPRELEQILVNLVRNAGEAMTGPGEVRIRLTGAPMGSGDGPLDLVVEVCDSGAGMDPAVLERAMEPFFTTRPGAGGLGLSTVNGLLRRVGGGMEIRSRVGVGTDVIVRVPGSHEAPVEREPPRYPEEPVPLGETILVVEDEEVVRSLAERILRRRGYQVLSAAGGQEALEVAEGAPFALDLVLSDVVMPGMSGPETVAELVRRGHRCRVLYMSGYTDDHLDPYGVSRHGIDFLPKPFDPEALLRRVRETLDLSAVPPAVP